MDRSNGLLPDLPQGYDWPAHNGQALDFLAQINLAELEAGFHPLFPESGWLYFFAGDIWDQNVIPQRVLYFDGPVTDLAPSAPPPYLKGPSMMNRETALIGLAPGFSMDQRFVDLFWWSFNNEPAYERYSHLAMPLMDVFQREKTRIGGYPYGFQGGGADRWARLYLNGFETLIRYGYFHMPPFFPSEDKREAYYQRRYEEIEAAGDLGQYQLEAEKYQEIKSGLEVKTAPVEMLLGLGSTMGRCWGDAGFLQFFIRQDDLAARRFEHTFCDVIST
ncbi:MAG: DUF1963 domain-containing protein [Anaerolineales bacterium]|nr:DUF1963 domain-containing protein [Anaerolineales bacterium]